VKLVPILLENYTSKYEYGAVMVFFSFPELKRIQQLVDKQDVYIRKGDKTYGLEDQPHVTLLYGLYDGLSEEVVGLLLKDVVFGECKLHNISVFRNEKYDVLKFDVSGTGLKKANSKLKQLPYTNDFPEYHPHLTIGYVKKGKGDYYADLIKKQKLNNFILTPNKIVYSEPNGLKHNIKITTI
jgi:2'-5' RNA ligase